MKKLFNHFARILIVAVHLFVSFPGFTQKIVTRIIIGKDGLPLAGVTIGIEGTNQTVFSAVNGRFSLSVKPRDVLLVSAVGMVKRSVQVINQTFITITFAFVINSMEEILVIGYGTSRRKDVTGAVSKLTENDFNPAPWIALQHATPY